MPSKSKSIDGADLKRWGVLVGTGATVGALSVITGQVIPEIGEMGGSTNTMIVLALTFAVDFVRRFLTDTRVVPKEEAEKLVVVTDKEVEPVVLPIQVVEEKGFVAWVKRLFR